MRVTRIRSATCWKLSSSLTARKRTAITPWSDIMELLRRELPKYGGSFIQTEDEIAAISMAIGASYAGRVAVTGSSGPGISLKTEALGWAVMAEVPLVICDIQRGGDRKSTRLNSSHVEISYAVFCL